MPDRCEVAGAVVRAYVDELRGLGVLDEIRPHLSQQAEKFLDKPPMPVSWVEVRLAHEPLVALSRVRGREEVRALAHRVVRGKVGAILKPLLTTTLRLFGGTPATLFSRLDTLTAVMLRGVKFSWTATGPTAGTVGIEYPYAVDPALFATWEGMLHLGFDLAQTAGKVAQARVQEGGRRGEVDLSW
ncbi:MAG: hypothetical protein ACM3PC_12800 [Deltaproteobacteria bacterium]